MAALAEQLHISSVTLSVMCIKEVGLAVGYEDDHVFTRRFKSYTGKTPGQYREEHK